MSDAKQLTVEEKAARYSKQMGERGITVTQRRQLRKTQVRQDHEENRAKLKDKQRTRRARFREWMAGMR